MLTQMLRNTEQRAAVQDPPVPILPEVEGQGGGSQEHGCIPSESYCFFAWSQKSQMYFMPLVLSGKARQYNKKENMVFFSTVRC